MNKFLILIMFLLVSGSLSTMIHQNQLIKIQTNDNQEFEIPINVANTSKIIKDMLKDIGIHNKEKEDELPISLPMISSTQFNLILPAMQNLAELYAKEPHKNKREILNQHLQTIVTNFKINDQPFNNQQLIAFIAGTNYFDIPLVQPALQELARRALQPYDWLKLELLGDKLIDLWQMHPAHEPILLDHLKNKETIQSADGKHLISWSRQEGTIRIWNINKPTQKPIIFHHSGCTSAIKTSNDKYLISSSWEEGTIKIWSMNNPTQKPITLAHPGCKLAIESLNKKYIISSSWQEGTIKIWNINNLNQTPIILDHYWPRTMTQTSKHIISSSWQEGTIKIWNINNLNQTPIILKHFRCEGVIESLDSQNIISFSWQEGTIKIWNINNLNQNPTILNHFRCKGIMESRDGKQLISWSCQEGTIKIWNTNNLDQPTTLEYDWCSGITETSDGQTLITWSFDEGTILIRDKNQLNQPPTTLDHAKCSSVTESSDGKLFISRSYQEGTIKIWDKNNLNQNPTILNHFRCKGIIKTINGKQLFSWSGNHIKIWNLTFIHPSFINPSPKKILLLLAIYFAHKRQFLDLPTEKHLELRAIFNELPPTTQTFLEKKASNFIAAIKTTQQ